VLSDDHIDVSWSALATYGGGAHAVLAASMTALMPRTAVVAGDRGSIVVPANFHHPSGFALTIDGETELVTEPVIGAGYAHEVIEVQRCLRLGLSESPLVPLDETVRLLDQMDVIRREIGVSLPGDRSPD
jgi:hypothetical protein